MKQELLKDSTDTISIVPYLNNRPAVASSALVTITKPGGTVIVTAASGTINATTGEITYDLTSSLNNQLGENFKAAWTYVISGVTYYQTTLFDVVLNRLAISVVDDDLLNEQADILERNESFAGAVASSGSTSLVCTNLKTYVDDYWNGGKVTAVDPSTGIEQVRNITDFVQSTGTLTVDVAWASNPTSSYTFIVKRGFQKKIEQAFDEMMLDIKNRGYRPALILESSELKVPLIKKSLSLICRDFMREPEDKWMILSNEYKEQYVDMFGKLTFQYDQDESGTVGDEGEKNRNAGSVRMRR